MVGAGTVCRDDPPGEAGALSGALDLLLEDSALRGRMSAAAYRRASYLLRCKDTVAGFRGVLKELDEKSSNSRRPKNG